MTGKLFQRKLNTTTPRINKHPLEQANTRRIYQTESSSDKQLVKLQTEFRFSNTFGAHLFSVKGKRCPGNLKQGLEAIAEIQGCNRNEATLTTIPCGSDKNGQNIMGIDAGATYNCTSGSPSDVIQYAWGNMGNMLQKELSSQGYANLSQLITDYAHSLPNSPEAWDNSSLAANATMESREPGLGVTSILLITAGSMQFTLATCLMLLIILRICALKRQVQQNAAESQTNPENPTSQEDTATATTVSGLN